MLMLKAQMFILSLEALEIIRLSEKKKRLVPFRSKY